MEEQLTSANSKNGLRCVCCSHSCCGGIGVLLSCGDRIWEYKPLNVWFWQQSHYQREVFLFRCYYNNRVVCFSVMHFFTFVVSLSSCDRACLSSLMREASQEGPLPTSEKSAGCFSSSMSIRVTFCQVSTDPRGSFSVCLVISMAARALVKGTVQLCLSVAGYNIPNPGYGVLSLPHWRKYQNLEGKRKWVRKKVDFFFS